MGVLENVKTIAKTIGRFIYHHRADISFYSGMVGTAVGTGLFVNGALKSQPALQEYKDKKKQINEATDLTDEQKKKMNRENTTTALKAVGKNMLPATAVSALGYGAEVYGHHTLHTELDGATALANGLAASIAVLHQRIASAEGEDKWREYAYGENIEHVENVDMSTGEVIEETNIIQNGNAICDFSRDFRYSTQFSDAKGINQRTLNLLKSCLNNKLEQNATPNKKIFLRDVWASVFGNLDGFKEEWANAGWLYEDLDGSRMTIEFWPTSSKDMDTETIEFLEERRPDIKIRFNCYPNVYYIERLKKQRNR